MRYTFFLSIIICIFCFNSSNSFAKKNIVGIMYFVHKSIRKEPDICRGLIDRFVKTVKTRLPFHTIKLVRSWEIGTSVLKHIRDLNLQGMKYFFTVKCSVICNSRALTVSLNVVPRPCWIEVTLGSRTWKCKIEYKTTTAAYYFGDKHGIQGGLKAKKSTYNYFGVKVRKMALEQYHKLRNVYASRYNLPLYPPEQLSRDIGYMADLITGRRDSYDLILTRHMSKCGMSLLAVGFADTLKLQSYHSLSGMLEVYYILDRNVTLRFSFGVGEGLKNRGVRTQFFAGVSYLIFERWRSGFQLNVGLLYTGQLAFSQTKVRFHLHGVLVGLEASLDPAVLINRDSSFRLSLRTIIGPGVRIGSTGMPYFALPASALFGLSYQF
ncbi:hypothetical protein KKH43_03480 [Patescibacteria group bacterium]|nr:hypothetical protein [Patescibacteria group bacterium]